jgi:hypothetical protein
MSGDFAGMHPDQESTPAYVPTFGFMEVYGDGRPVLCDHDCGNEADCDCSCCAAGHAGVGLCKECCATCPVVCDRCHAQRPVEQPSAA